jgi:hypothetical protein
VWNLCGEGEEESRLAGLRPRTPEARESSCMRKVGESAAGIAGSGGMGLYELSQEHPGGTIGKEEGRGGVQRLQQVFA